jgi:two-component system CitB family sensor kinase
MVTVGLPRRRTLAAQILVIESAVVVVMALVGFLGVVWYQHGNLVRQYERRALAVAQATAASGPLQEAVEEGDPGGAVQKMAMAVMRATGVAYVVVTNARGIRYSHPNPALIGKPVYDDPEPPASEPFRTGKAWTGVQKGTLGLTARGKVPLFDAHHRLIGEVSVGIYVEAIWKSLLAALPQLALYMAAALAFGAGISIGLSRRLKRQTFGLELGQIASMLQEREAMLHGIREGLLGIDKKGRVLLANDEARRLLGLPEDVRGRHVRELLPPGRLLDVATGVTTGADQPLVVGDRVLVANRMPVRLDHRAHVGWVVTFQDRTESEGLLRELDTVAGLAEALRAQSHEFSNRLHTVVGLVQLGLYDEAVSFVTDLTSARNELSGALVDHVDNPVVAALLLGKSSVAAERGVRLRVVPEGRLALVPEAVQDVTRVLGNLVDNALDAAATGTTAPTAPFVEVRLLAVGSDLVVSVADSGPGVPEADRAAIFEDGWTTKPSRTGATRGLGLALVREVVSRRGGIVDVGQEVGAVFSVLLPGVAVPASAPSQAENAQRCGTVPTGGGLASADEREGSPQKAPLPVGGRS